MRSRSAPSLSTSASASAATATANSRAEPARLLALARQSALASTRVPKFLRSLYDMLHHEDPSILAWAPGGAFFQVFDTRRLEAAVLPKYFKHSKFSSFQRQLNNFGFRKWTKTQSSVCTFSHQHLVRCHPLRLAELVARHAAADAAPRSPAGPKRALDAADASDASAAGCSAADQRISPRAAKLIKRDPLASAPESDKRASAEALCAQPATTAWDAAPQPCWALDPALFQRPELASAELSSAFGASLDGLGDLLLAAPDAYERSFELRMLNECLDLAPPSAGSGSFVGLLTGAGNLPPQSPSPGPLAMAPLSMAWGDFGRADVTL